MRSPYLPSVLVAVHAFLSACIVVDPAKAPIQSSAEMPAGVVPRKADIDGPFFEKSYELGARAFAKAGEPVIHVRSYHIERKPCMRPSNDFSYKRGITYTDLRGLASTAYPISGTETVNGVPYTVVDIELDRLLIGPDGTCAKSHSFSVGGRIANVTVSPHTTFSAETRETRFPGAQNFELLYSGIDGASIKILYREFSGEDVARPAFFQELSYDKAQGQIVFRTITMRVDEITPDGIAYTVIEDGLPE